MTLQERVEKLREQVAHFSSAILLTNQLSKSRELRDEVQSIYSLMFGRQLTGCLNCIADAVFEILSRSNMAGINPFEYLLSSGSLLHDVVNMDSAKAMSNANITEELSLYHLATNPGCEKQFIRLPEDWRQRLEAYQQRTQVINSNTGRPSAKKQSSAGSRRKSEKSTEK